MSLTERTSVLSLLDAVPVSVSVPVAEVAEARPVVEERLMAAEGEGPFDPGSPS